MSDQFDSVYTNLLAIQMHATREAFSYDAVRFSCESRMCNARYLAAIRVYRQLLSMLGKL